ncbi:MAG: ABC transporter permease [Deltaproteobacteria bacterium]|jgi:putative spermidine/putrescine transport system permease protein|nr:ABC transporter permease [Deltaproteobacteria bacterium]
MKNKTPLVLFFAPAMTVFAAFFILPLGRLAVESAGGPEGLAIYCRAVSNPRYLKTLLDTMLISVLVACAAVTIGGVTGLFLERNSFRGRAFLVALPTLPISFPGVVVGFMIIMLAGRQGLVGRLTNALAGSRLVFAYSAPGLLAGYLYFSIPRVVATVMAAAGETDMSLEEAARVLGASPRRVFLDVTAPSLAPALVSAGAVCFATSVGAFGTALTLAADLSVLPVVYAEFTLSANIVAAAMLSIVLGLVAWAALLPARMFAGPVAAGGPA